MACTCSPLASSEARTRGARRRRTVVLEAETCGVADDKTWPCLVVVERDEAAALARRSADLSKPRGVQPLFADAPARLELDEGARRPPLASDEHVPGAGGHPVRLALSVFPERQPAGGYANDACDYVDRCCGKVSISPLSFCRSSSPSRDAQRPRPLHGYMVEVEMLLLHATAAYPMMVRPLAGVQGIVDGDHDDVRQDLSTLQRVRPSGAAPRPRKTTCSTAAAATCSRLPSSSSTSVLPRSGDLPDAVDFMAAEQSQAPSESSSSSEAATHLAASQGFLVASSSIRQLISVFCVLANRAAGGGGGTPLHPRGGALRAADARACLEVIRSMLTGAPSSCSRSMAPRPARPMAPLASVQHVGGGGGGGGDGSYD
ncbi:hypothetical protein HU200_031182 [Digitaria exilis]|uniref:Uncharacterized protein n=1 Tax=Digitaria exilis TaxID=1010633 RepID=A0A835BQ56_9POAL|nr:hypothetical protein HU200_031182 [Digitaria exilis]